MVFDKVFFFSTSMILLNVSLVLKLGLSWALPVQIVAIILMSSMEFKRQAILQRIISIRRQIEYRTLPLEDIEQIITRPQHIPATMLILLYDYHIQLSRQLHEDNVNWKRDGF